MQKRARNIVIHEDKTKEPGAIAFAIWVHLTYFLAECGWTTDELVKDVTWHSENAMRNEG